MLQCVGYFSIVAWTLEIQLDLAELWLQAESFVLPGRCLGLRGLLSPWHTALTRHRKQPPRGCLQPFGAQQPCRPADGRRLSSPWPWRERCGCLGWETASAHGGVPAGVCPTSGPASHPAPGSGFAAGRGADAPHAAGKAAR